MPAKSQAQQRFFGMIESGARPRPKGMTAAQVHEFAATKRKGLPGHAAKSKSARRRRVAEARAGR